MITKYVVNGDTIDLYQDEDIVDRVPNNEDNLDMAKLYNNLIFVTKDIALASRREEYFHVKLRRNAIFTLMFGVLAFIDLGNFNNVVFFMLLLNLFSFIINNGKHKESYKRLSSYKEIEKSITEKMARLITNTKGEKVSNCSLEFTNDQITMDHQEWVQNIGDYYDYSNDLNTIQNSKILIRK
jgi:hypothetical protein